MSIELITGAAEEAHISSNDIRAVNRSNFGSNRYILKDDDKLSVNISTATGTVVIKPGSCMWCGMHIRCVSETKLTYVVPTSEKFVKIWLHYKKEPDTFYESVEWLITVGQDLSPELTKLEDNTMEAYTVFCSFTHNPLASEAQNFVCEFVEIATHEDFNLPTINSNIKQAKEEAMNSSINSAKTYTDAKTKNLDERITKNENNISTLQSSKTLYNGVKSLSGGAALSVSLTGYKFIGFQFRGSSYTQKGFALIPLSLIVGGTGTSNYLAVAIGGLSIKQLEYSYDGSRLEFKSCSGISIETIYGYN